MAKKKKLKLRKGRVIKLVATIGTITAILSSPGQSMINKILGKTDNIITQESDLLDEIDKMDGYIGNEIDSFSSSTYHMNESFRIYIKGNDDKFPVAVSECDGNVDINVFNMYSFNDTIGNNFVYCDIPSEGISGLMEPELLKSATFISKQPARFNEIYQISSPKEDVEVKMSISDNSKDSGISLKDNDVVFAISDSIKAEDNSNWIQIRNNDGQVGFVKCTSALKPITNGVLSQCVDFDSGKDLPHNFYYNERVVSIGDGINKNFSKVLYYDKKGFLKADDISKDLIKEVDLDVVKAEATKNIDADLENWHMNYSQNNGVYGIDFMDVDPEDLEHILNSEPNIQYVAFKIGGTGWGINDGNLSISYNDTVSVNFEFKEKVQKVLDTIKSHDKLAIGYFYASDANPREGIEVAKQIEQCIDAINGKGIVIPAVDSEIGGDFENYPYEDLDRVYFLNNPNYSSYVMQTGNTIDLEYIRSLRKENNVYDQYQYIENHPEVVEYIEYCQDLKAQSLAAIYQKLYNDDYMPSNCSILYTGNGAVSKNTYKAPVSGWEKIALFKSDDVLTYLTNPESPYYVKDACLKLWFADYTIDQNFQVFGNDVAMVQYCEESPITDRGVKVDKNIANPTFISLLSNTKKLTMTQENDFSER